jgi:hypothetical protein
MKQFMNIRTLALIILTTILSDIWAMAQSKQKTQIPPKESSVNANCAKDSLVGEDRWALGSKLTFFEEGWIVI